MYIELFPKYQTLLKICKKISFLNLLFNCTNYLCDMNKLGVDFTLNISMFLYLAKSQ